MGSGEKREAFEQRLDRQLAPYNEIERLNRSLIAEKAYSAHLYKEVQRRIEENVACELSIEEMAQELLFYKGHE